MYNNKVPEFNYDKLRTLYDTEPRIKTIIKNFDQNHVEFSQGSIDNLEKSAKQKKSNISAMAKQAVDLKK